MSLSSLSLASSSAIKQCFSSTKRRIIAISLLLVCGFVFTWLRIIGQELTYGSSYIFLNIGFLYLGVRDLLQYRRRANSSDVSEEQLLLGYVLMIVSALLFIPLSFSVSIQSLLFAGVIFGLILCLYGARFFLMHKLTMSLFFISLYPNLNFAAHHTRTGLTGSLLEEFMAWLGYLGFQILGKSSHVDGVLLFLDDGAVEVASGCSGADMAIPIAGMAIIMGILFNQSYKKTAALAASGIALALAFNVPRVMLLTVAIVHWGQESFDFWHGPWGGQIFSGVLFTVYYYLFMWIADIDSPQAST